TWGGQIDMSCRIIHGFDPQLPGIIRETLKDDKKTQELLEQMKKLEFPIPYQVLPLQDCVDLAVAMIRETITFQSLSAVVRGVGGPLDVAVITRRNKLTYVQQKELAAMLAREGKTWITQ